MIGCFGLSQSISRIVLRMIRTRARFGLALSRSNSWISSVEPSLLCFGDRSPSMHVEREPRKILEPDQNRCRSHVGRFKRLARARKIGFQSSIFIRRLWPPARALVRRPSRRAGCARPAARRKGKGHGRRTRASRARNERGRPLRRPNPSLYNVRLPLF